MANMGFSRGDSPDKITIASGQTVSSACDMRNCVSAGIVVPAAFTGTTLGFQVSHDGVTYQVHTAATGGTATSITVAQGKSYAVPTDVAVWPWFKVVSGSAEGADRDIWIVRKR